MRKDNFRGFASHFGLTQRGFADWTATCRFEFELGGNPAFFAAANSWVNGSLNELAWKQVGQYNILTLQIKRTSADLKKKPKELLFNTSARVNNRLFHPEISTGKSLELGLYGKKDT